jgi:hypothetical protein
MHTRAKTRETLAGRYRPNFIPEEIVPRSEAMKIPFLIFVAQAAMLAGISMIFFVL